MYREQWLLSPEFEEYIAEHTGQYPKIGDFKEWKFGFFFSAENNSFEFWQNVNHSIGDHKNVKTCRQCISVTEKTEFFFFMSLFSGIANTE